MSQNLLKEQIEARTLSPETIEWLRIKGICEHFGKLPSEVLNEDLFNIECLSSILEGEAERGEIGLSKADERRLLHG